MSVGDEKYNSVTYIPIVINKIPEKNQTDAASDRFNISAIPPFSNPYIITIIKIYIPAYSPLISQ